MRTKETLKLRRQIRQFGIFQRICDRRLKLNQLVIISSPFLNIWSLKMKHTSGINLPFSLPRDL